ncbi:MAG: hypothetical protein ACJ78Q_01180 [Chloroflexia bacterium]
MDHPPRINISRSDYERALAKWKAQKIEEYEISTYLDAFPGRTSNLHVNDYGNNVEEAITNTSPLPEMSEEDRRYRESEEYANSLKRDTVEGLFARIDALLKNRDAIESAAWMGAGHFYMQYTVGFDLGLGYPNHITGRPITDPGSYVNDADWDETVTNLKIIKQGK